MVRNAFLSLLFLLGIFDSLYLSLERLRGVIPPCSAGVSFFACDTVLQSSYSQVFGIPLAYLGFFYYGVSFLVSLLVLKYNFSWAKRFLVLSTSAGFVTSLYLVYLQLFVLFSICLYCMISAILSIVAGVLTHTTFAKERKEIANYFIHNLYVYGIRRLLFTVDSEKIHTLILTLAKHSNYKLLHKLLAFVFSYSDNTITQKVSGIKFATPIGLAAGFDYEADLTQLLPHLGFGFETVGTITNKAYEGNPYPRLGRLPKSRSLLVNKGFKNLGMNDTLKKLSKYKFHYPLGISVGRTNSSQIKTHKEAISDIVTALQKAERSNVRHSYYELNISCPNLGGDISFYSPIVLAQLLKAVGHLNIKKPIFIKMPIELSDASVRALLREILKSNIQGVIFGNLQKNRKESTLVKSEVEKYPKGSFSGKPTQKRSDELIRLAYNYCGKKLVIIGCGGIFSADDAYKKIRNGATLCQLITGMVFEGPQIASQVSLGISERLKKDGFDHISQVIGIDA